MEAAVAPLARTHGGLPVRLPRGEVVGAWLLGFVPIVYLALKGGGYDLVARSEVGLAIWWIVLVGVLVGALPRSRLSAVAWAAFGLLGAYLAWTWLAAGWSQNAERSLAEAGRLGAYAGAFVLAICVVNRATLRHLIGGLASSTALVAGLAVLSRLHPAWFPAVHAADLYASSRLAYPLNYSDGVGEFAALGLPLLLLLATDARTVAGRALSAAAMPPVVLCIALSVSRGGVLAAIVGLICFFCLVPERIPRIATALAAGAGSTVVVYGLVERPLVRDGFRAAGSNAAGQRHSMLVILLLVCVGVALLQSGSNLAWRHAVRLRRLAFTRRQAGVATGALVCAMIVALIVGIAAGTDHTLWQRFKQPNAGVVGDQYFRLFSISGSHRYQYWQAAVAAFHVNPWKGIGPGTFELWWAQHNSLGEFVRNAHSLYIETLAELGIVGLALVGGFVVFVLSAGSLRAFRAPRSTRAMLAAAVAAFAGFAAAASVDWVWQIAVIPLIGLMLAAGILVTLHGGARSRGEPKLVRSRLVLAIAALPALVAIVVPLAATSQLRASEAAARGGNYKLALSDAANAQRIEPSAATPRLQRALVLEQLGDLKRARLAAAQATRRGPTDWRIWLVSSRIAAESNRPKEALADYRRGRALNPKSSLFR